MIHKYKTIPMSNPKANMWKKLFEMWCKDNDITKVTCELSKGGTIIVGPRTSTPRTHSTKRIKVCFQQPSDVLLFQVKNPSMWKNFVIPDPAPVDCQLVVR